MCVRYYFDERDLAEANRIADLPLKHPEKSSFGDVHPSEYSVIVRRQNRQLITEEMQWGFPSGDRKLQINARAESALQKKMFSESVRSRRCVIPAGCFYEWNRDKVKHTFSGLTGSTLFMAGIYDLFDNIPCFTVLTTDANETMRPVHDRMPLILPEEHALDWIRQDDQVSWLLSFQPLPLKRIAEIEQLSLMDFL